jgi:branched-chain amino acid transport system permease protein
MAIMRTKTQWVLLAVGFVFFFALALYLPLDWLAWLILLGIYSVAVLGMHIQVGLCGQFSMGHAAFMLVGAYTAALVGGEVGLSPWLTLPLAGVFAGIAGIVFGIPALRIKGFYLVMATMAAQFILQWMAQNATWSWLPSWMKTGGVYGTSVPDLVLAGKPIGDVGFWWLTLGVLAICIYFAKNIQRTSTGRKFIAVRDNDLAAEVMGINLFRTKLLALFIGCFFAGIAGWLWAQYMGHITPAQFDFKLSLIFLAMVIVGGIGSTTGAIMGAVIIQLFEKLIDYIAPALGNAFPSVSAQVFPAMSLIVFALVVMIFIMFEPRGAYYGFTRIKTYYRLYPFSY